MLDPRTPVLVGVGSITQRGEGDIEVADLDEPLALMRRAAEAAAADSSVPDLLARVGLVLVPKGIWDYPDAAGQLAVAIQASARTVVGEVGILQQTLITRAAAEIAAGHVDVALVAGGEARHRAVLARRQGVDAPDTIQPGQPDELLVPDGEIITAVEIERDLAVPAHQYALVESVLRHEHGWSADEQRRRLGSLWAGFAAVAADNPDAWDRSGPAADAIAVAAADNRMIASPYTKRLCSQWNVDQAAALLLTSVEVAEAAGVPRDRWVFLAATAESQAMVPLPNRVDLHRSFGTALAGRGALAALGLEMGEIEHRDIYSCFPAAVQVQVRELGLDLMIDQDEDAPLTVTGGMTFGGGPLNSYVLHSTATMARRLRGDPGSRGLVTSVSGMLTKPAVAVWSTEPGPQPFAPVDVTAEARAAIATCPVDPSAVGAGRIVAHTVVHDGGVASRSVAVVELADGVRTVAVDADRDRAMATASDDRVDEPVQVTGPGVFS